MINNALDKVIESDKLPYGIDQFQLKYKNVELQIFVCAYYGLVYDKNGEHEYCDGYRSLDELLDVVVKELDEPKSIREILRETPSDEVQIYF